MYRFEVNRLSINFEEGLILDDRWEKMRVYLDSNQMFSDVS